MASKNEERLDDIKWFQCRLHNYFEQTLKTINSKKDKEIVKRVFDKFNLNIQDIIKSLSRKK